jgi:hypothetical protein
VDEPIELLTPEQDIQDSKDARRNKRVQDLQRSQQLNRGNIWLSNAEIPINLQPAATIYRIMAKTLPKGFWSIADVTDKRPSKLYCDSPRCHAMKKQVRYASYERWMLLCYDCMDIYMQERGVSSIRQLQGADE